VVPSAIASDEPPEAQAAKGKKPKKCTKGKVPVTINGRRRCLSLKAALPRPRAADPRLLAAQAALGLDLGKIRDRRGRRSVSVGKLLGSKRMRTAENAIKQGLGTLDRLRARTALASSSASLGASASSVATVSAQGCAGQSNNPTQSGEFKGAGFDAKVDVGTGAATIGIDVGEGGIRAEIDFGICEKADDKFKAPDCPDAEGTLEASDESSFYLNMRVFKGSELLLSQNFEFSGETKIEPIQVDDDAKIEYFEIEHTYKTSIEVGGSSQEFGRVSLKLTYHGSTRVNFPGATYDPTHTDVEVKFNVEGAQADDAHELRDMEFDQELTAKREADKNFAAAVDKAIKKLGEKEAHWNKPNVCADIKFDPVSDTLTLERGQGGGFKARIESRGGGSPAGAKWTLTESQNATIGPPRALANPASFSYTVTNAGKGIEVQGAFRATSRAGVAEGTWTQPTKELPPPPPAEAFTGSIAGSAKYDEYELGAGNQLSAEWSGNVKLQQDPPFELPGFPVTTYSYKPVSGSIVYSFTGSLSDCNVVAGSASIDLGAQFDLTTGASLILLEGDPRPFHYQFVLPMPLFVTVPGTKSGCDDPEDEGDSFDWIPAAGIPALVWAPESAGQVLAADESFSGAGSGDTGGGSPDQTWQWALAPVP
jgi:hypothetical protein